ncbi:MAG TPA: hypothetical protein ENN63_08375 [Bacteroidetes bacterium]|nr:hypothetical protein [Bacteroidota bacterium]
MKARISPFIFVVTAGILFSGLDSCVKDTWDMDTFSNQGELNPKVALKMAKGRLDLGNAIEADDTTVRFNPDQSISILFKEDSVISFDVNELIEIPLSIPESGPETKTFTAGELSIDDFSTVRNISLQEIASNLPEPYQSEIIGNDGQNAVFPAISPPVDAGSYTTPSFGNYAMVTFSSGTVYVTLTNELPVELDPVEVRVVDANGTEVGTVLFNNVAANGGSQTRQIDLAGLTLINNEFTAQIIGFGTPGSSDPVLIDLTDQIRFDIGAENVVISSGTAILPDQVFAQDAGSMDLGLSGGEEVREIIIKTAEINYSVTSNIQEDILVRIVLPSATVNGSVPEYEMIIPYNGGNPTPGTLLLDDVKVDMTTDPVQPYNIFPFEYEIEIVSSNNMVTFDLTDDLVLEFTVDNISFAYMEGYLGHMVETFDQDTVKIEDEVLDRITGTFQLADPRIQFFYTNSFGIPIEMALDVTGYFNGGSSVDLGAQPEVISFPADTLDLFITDTLRFDNANTNLEDLLVLPPPFEVVFSGSATVNPEEDNTISNFVTDRSRIDVGLEAEIPLDFSASNLSLVDTVEVDIGEDFDPTNIAYSKIYLGVTENWFPMDLNFQITPYDSVSHTTGTPLNVELLAAAPVNADGIVETPSEYTTVIDLESDFFTDLSESTQLIIRVTLTTSGGGTDPVKLMTYYSLDFNIGLLTEFSFPFEL